MISATRRRISSMSRRIRHEGYDRLMSSGRQYLGQYLTIVSGSVARVTIQGVYFVLLANTLSLTDFGLFAGISAAGLIIGAFAGLGFASAAFRTAATKSRLVGRYLASLYVTFLVSMPLCIGAAYLLYEFAFSGRLALSTYLALAVSDIVLWRLLEVVSQVNNGLGKFFQASLGPVIGSASRLVAAVIFKLTFTSLDEWALMYLVANGVGTAFYIWAFSPSRRICFRGATLLIIGTLRDSLLFAFSFFVFYTQSELDKLIATLLVDGRTAGIYAISMRILDLTGIPVRCFVLLLVREIMRSGRQISKWGTGLVIEAGLAAVSLVGFAVIALVLTAYPTLLGRQVAEAASLFMFMPLVPPFKYLQEYHAELFFAWRRMDVRAFTAVLLTVMKAALTVVIFLIARDLRHMGVLFNLSFAVTYVVSATILFLTFYRARSAGNLIENAGRLEGAVTQQAR
jgi:O-antigen/teichoic acid export membrane protein